MSLVHESDLFQELHYYSFHRVTVTDLAVWCVSGVPVVSEDLCNSVQWVMWRSPAASMGPPCFSKSSWRNRPRHPGHEATLPYQLDVSHFKCSLIGRAGIPQTSHWLFQEPYDSVCKWSLCGSWNPWVLSSPSLRGSQRERRKKKRRGSDGSVHWQREAVPAEELKTFTELGFFFPTSPFHSLPHECCKVRITESLV